MKKPNPIQPLAADEHGVMRFQGNAIVSHLLYHGGIDLNQLACMEFSSDDRMQFAQLIGYSLSGAGDLSYFDNATWEAAQKIAELGITEVEARNEQLRETLEKVRDGLRAGIAELYEISADDLVRS